MFTRDFNRTHKFVGRFITFVFALIIVFFIIIGGLFVVAGVTLFNTDWSEGVKPVIERVWCGSDCSEKTD